MFIRDKDFDSFAFRINDKNLPEQIENYQPQQSGKKKAFDYKEVSEEKHREALTETFKEDATLPYGVLIERLQTSYADIGCKCGKVKIKALKVFLENKRMIVQEADKSYSYNPKFYY
jgi:uncharacterized protein YabN with tetrapyrrole methylase and pyrophosphatase domain